MRKVPPYPLERVDAFFVAQQMGRRVPRMLLWSGLLVGSLLWLSTVLPSEPAAAEMPLPVVDPFTEAPLVGESTNTVQFEQRN